MVASLVSLPEERQTYTLWSLGLRMSQRTLRGHSIGAFPPASERTCGRLCLGMHTLSLNYSKALYEIIWKQVETVILKIQYYPPAPSRFRGEEGPFDNVTYFQGTRNILRPRVRRVSTRL